MNLEKIKFLLSLLGDRDYDAILNSNIKEENISFNNNVSEQNGTKILNYHLIVKDGLGSDIECFLKKREDSDNLCLCKVKNGKLDYYEYQFQDGKYCNIYSLKYDKSGIANQKKYFATYQFNKSITDENVNDISVSYCVNLEKMKFLLSLLQGTNNPSYKEYNSTAFVKSNLSIEEPKTLNHYLLIKDDSNNVECFFKKKENGNKLCIGNLENGEINYYEYHFYSKVDSSYCTIYLLNHNDDTNTDQHSYMVTYQFDKDILTCKNINDVSVLDCRNFKNIGANHGHIHS